MRLRLIKDGSLLAKEIETNIGHLVHLLGLTIPFVRNFMSRLRDLHTIEINNKCLKDLKASHGLQTLGSA